MNYDITHLQPNTFHRIYTNTSRTVLSIYTVRNQKITYTFENKQEFDDFAKQLNMFCKAKRAGVVIYVDNSKI